MPQNPELETDNLHRSAAPVAAQFEHVFYGKRPTRMVRSMETRWEREEKFVLIKKGLSVDHDGGHVYSVKTVKTNAFDSSIWPEGWNRIVPCSDTERSRSLFESVANWADANGYKLVG